ncbi:hypothetical protein M3Y97_00884200 [Aphelenchoides bicaudatus]|nr:hypothetical protein M3Y97_00884200 [Aphelenchoides bicaudatus]
MSYGVLRSRSMSVVSSTPYGRLVRTGSLSSLRDYATDPDPVPLNYYTGYWPFRYNYAYGTPFSSYPRFSATSYATRWPSDIWRKPYVAWRNFYNFRPYGWKTLNYYNSYNSHFGYKPYYYYRRSYGW